MKTTYTEVELAAVVILWLEQMGWDVYQEVTHLTAIDIVAVSKPRVWVIECKLHFNLNVLEQAYRQRRHAHMVSVAVPWRKAPVNYKERFWQWGDPNVFQSFKADACLNAGIGVLGVRLDSRGMNNPCRIEETIKPRFNRRAASSKLLGALSENHKTFTPAGASAAKRWTPFKQTFEDIRKFVASNPGVDLNTLIENVPTHYANPCSAKSAIVKWLDNGYVEGIDIRRDGGKVQLYLSDDNH